MSVRKRRESVINQPEDSIGEHFKRMEDDNTKSKGFLQASVNSKGKRASGKVKEPEVESVVI